LNIVRYRKGNAMKRHYPARCIHQEKLEREMTSECPPVQATAESATEVQEAAEMAHLTGTDISVYAHPDSFDGLGSFDLLRDDIGHIRLGGEGKTTVGGTKKFRTGWDSAFGNPHHN
jgi:hypothetical protein